MYCQQAQWPSPGHCNQGLYIYSVTTVSLSKLHLPTMASFSYPSRSIHPLISQLTAAASPSSWLQLLFKSHLMAVIQSSSHPYCYLPAMHIPFPPCSPNWSPLYPLCPSSDMSCLSTTTFKLISSFKDDTVSSQLRSQIRESGGVSELVLLMLMLPPPVSLPEVPLGVGLGLAVLEAAKAEKLPLRIYLRES